jgi:hypothetical protein
VDRIQQWFVARKDDRNGALSIDIHHDLAQDYQTLIDLEGFLIYSPENSYLRSSDREGQIQPLGIRGEGLFRYPRYLSSAENAPRLEDIKHRMRLLEWFSDFAVSEEFPHVVRVDIQDKYIPKEVGAFDQLSTNEGFLIILMVLPSLRKNRNTMSEPPQIIATKEL